MDGFVNVACSKLHVPCLYSETLIIKANGLASVDQKYNAVHLYNKNKSVWILGTANHKTKLICHLGLTKLCPLPLQKKCDQYWPKEGSEHYGLIQVRLVHEEVLATYTIRKFAIRHTKVCI